MNARLSKVQDYLEWLKSKIYLDTLSERAKKRVVKRGEVYYCNFGKNIGSEEEKERPCLILQNNVGNAKSPNTIVAPITNSEGVNAVSVPIAGIYKYVKNGVETQLTGYILLNNITTVSKARLGDSIAALKEEMNEVNMKILTSLGLYGKYKDLLDKSEQDKKKIRELLHEVFELKRKLAFYETEAKERKL